MTIIYRQGGTHRYRFVAVFGNDDTVDELNRMGYPAWPATHHEAVAIGAVEIGGPFTELPDGTE